ncbi:MAG: stress-induced-phosphoprotein 1-like [Bacteroidetes bacterium]|jgi:tetratricopeptide (TPR) repeat protein|nr:stress-induced-phosphoprotein 1-like [Bacteroidota bacterium]
MMKKIYFLSPALLIAGILSAQTPEFKKAMDNGNAKYKIKSYNLAIMDYDAAIKIVSPEVDKLIASKSVLAPEQKYLIEPYELRANCYYYAGNPAKMKLDAEKVLMLDSSNANAKALIAYNQYKEGKKIDGCITMQAQAKKGSEIAAIAYKNCYCVNEGAAIVKEASGLNAVKKYDEALPKIDKALLILPDSGYVHAERGIALLGKGNSEEALKSLNIAIAQSQKSYKAYYNRAQIFMKLGKADSAQLDMNMCMKLNPTFYDGYYFRAQICEDLEQWASAIFDLKQCVKLHSADGKLDFRIAELYHLKQGDLYEACPYYKSSFQKGYEVAQEMSTNCDNPRYMKTHLKNAQKGGTK